MNNGPQTKTPAFLRDGIGEGIDRKLEKRLFTPVRIAVIAGVLLFTGAIAYGLSTTAGGKRLFVERDRLTISAVERGAFQEYIAVTGAVLPRTTVFLDAIQGGRVEEIYVEEGAVVGEGEPILRISNDNLLLSLLNVEAQRIEQTDRLQNTRFILDQNSLDLRRRLTEINYRIRGLESEEERRRVLYERQLIADEEYERVRNDLEYWLAQRELTIEAFQQDSLRSVAEIGRMQMALQRLDANLEMAEGALENLTVRAPIEGQLTALNAQVGAIVGTGYRFGQIDVLDGYKVRAAIDEFYIHRVQREQTGSGEIGGQHFELSASRVYPEVRDGRFEVDMDFVGPAPEGIRRGQTLRFNLELGDPAEALLLARGGFYQTTGGNWVYALVSAEDEAVRRYVRLGRQNPRFYEVLEGLDPGDLVVTSGYETFGDADRLLFR